MCDLPCKIVLVVVNIALFLIGVGLMTVGGLMTWGQSFIESIFKKYLTAALSALGQADNENIVNLVKRFLTSTGPLGLGIFIIGAVIACIAVLGFIGVCCGKVVLYIYAALVGVMAVAVLAVFIYYYVNRDKVSNKLADIYLDIVQKYISLEANDENSLAVLFVQGPLQCCGDHNYTDFTAMSPNDEFNKQPITNLKAPIPCCKFDDKYQISDSTCLTTFTDENSNWIRGCRTQIKQLLEDNLNIISYVMVGVFLVLLAIMILAILAACCY